MSPCFNPKVVYIHPSVNHYDEADLKRKLGNDWHVVRFRLDQGMHLDRATCFTESALDLLHLLDQPLR